MKRNRTYKALMGPLAFAAAFAAVATVTSLAGDDGTGGEVLRVRDPMSLFDPAVPLMLQGSDTTLAQAADQVGYAIPRPASLGEPSQVWVNADTGEVGLRYSDAGLTILLAPWPPGKDAETSLEASVQDLPLAYTTTIGGDPASVLPYDAERAVAPIDVVHVVVNGVEVSLYAPHATTGLDGVLAAAAETVG
jgi:hypothetical protein